MQHDRLAFQNSFSVWTTYEIDPYHVSVLLTPSVSEAATTFGKSQDAPPMPTVAAQREHHERWRETTKKRVANQSHGRSAYEPDSHARVGGDVVRERDQKQHQDQTGARRGKEKGFFTVCPRCAPWACGQRRGASVMSQAYSQTAKGEQV